MSVFLSPFSDGMKKRQNYSTAQEVGQGLMQLKIGPNDKETTKVAKKKMAAANSRRRKKSRLKRYAVMVHLLWFHICKG